MCKHANGSHQTSLELEICEQVYGTFDVLFEHRDKIEALEKQVAALKALNCLTMPEIKPSPAPVDPDILTYYKYLEQEGTSESATDRDTATRHRCEMAGRLNERYGVGNWGRYVKSTMRTESEVREHLAKQGEDKFPDCKEGLASFGYRLALKWVLNESEGK